MHTEKQLSDAIRRKAREKFEGISEEQVAALVKVAVTFGYDVRALDDQTYAEIASRSGEASGRSKRAIAQRLVVKGIDRETASAVVADVNDLRAAVVLARKRGFGPFRKAGRTAAREDEAGSGSPDEKRKLKELSAFARAGFSFEIGRMVFEMQSDEADDILGG